jgi:peptidoglycan/LPS O-acetylase OafA/YrhL
VATLLGRPRRRFPGGRADEAERTGANGLPTDGSPPPEPAVPPRLVHEPALDGLRGLAVLAVLVFHLDRARGGFLGVDLFFALSGYLITSLLVVERRTRGGIDLGAFWVRRARRLLPALLLVLVGVAVLLATLTAAADRPRFRGDALATLGYVANWHRMVAPATYWDIFSQPSPLDHTWSLAIEEQFYLVWPVVALVVLGGGRRLRRRSPGLAADASGAPDGSDRAARRLGLLALAGGAASLVFLALLWSPVDSNRAYFGTDARLGPTLLGAALATVTARRPRRARPPSVALDVAAAVALGAMAMAFLVIDGRAAPYYRGGLLAFTVAALVVIVAVTGGPPGRVARALSWRPLVVLGAISYGVYLWHWPVIVYLTPDRLGVRRIAAEALCVVVTLALALLSYRLVEQPVRRGALRGRVAMGATAVSAAVVLAAVVVTTRGLSSGVGETAADPAVVAQAGSRRIQFVPERVPAGATRLLLVGDSGPIFLAPELEDVAARTGSSHAIGLSAILDCAPALLSTEVRYAGDVIVPREPCPDVRRERWERHAEAMEADVVVYYIANTGGLGEQWLRDAWRTDCDPVFDTLLEQELGRDLDTLAATGATVVLATSPDVAILTAGSNDQTACRNETYRRVVADHPGTLMIDLHGFVGQLELPPGEDLMQDFVHLSGPAAQQVAAWMLPAVDVALRDAGAGH